jgi:hypothetical protein
LRRRRAGRIPVLGNRRYNEMLVDKYWNQ